MTTPYSVEPTRPGTSEANIGPWMLTEPAADSVRESDSDTMTVAVLAGDDKATRDLLANAPVAESHIVALTQALERWRDVASVQSIALRAVKRFAGEAEQRKVKVPLWAGLLWDQALAEMVVAEGVFNEAAKGSESDPRGAALAPVTRSAAEDALRRLEGLGWWLGPRDVTEAVADAVETLRQGLGRS
jgi:hypothetical protein